VRNPEAYAAAEARDGMIPWNGDAENMIDRFDGRALLDFYRDPDARRKQQKSDAEAELEEVRILDHCSAAQQPLQLRRWGVPSICGDE
jgi:hypothetical protein